MRIACTLVLQCCSFGVSTFGVTQSKAIRHFDEFSANRIDSTYYFLNEGEAICFVVIRLQWVWSGTLSVLCEYSNQSTVSTAKRLASLFRYLIASTIDSLHNAINDYEIACIWNSKVQCTCMYDPNKC